MKLYQRGHNYAFLKKGKAQFMTVVLYNRLILDFGVDMTYQGLDPPLWALARPARPHEKYFPAEGIPPSSPMPRLSKESAVSCSSSSRTQPDGSSKIAGMTAAISEAIGRGVETVICASTGNTAASAAAYAARAGLRAIV